jgi:hypothetical protein
VPPPPPPSRRRSPHSGAFSALALGAAVVCAHGAFRVPEDLFLDEPDQAAGSGNPLLSFIANATGGRV